MKPFWRSKTLWFNALALALTVAGAFGFGDFRPSPEVEAIALVIVTLINLVLRFATSQAVGLSRK